MRLFMRKELPKSMPEHHRTAMRHAQSALQALKDGDEAMTKSHLGHALRAFAPVGKPTADRQPMPMGDVD